MATLSNTASRRPLADPPTSSAARLHRSSPMKPRRKSSTAARHSSAALSMLAI
jgi:hypothetical protein